MFEGDLYELLPVTLRGCVDILVANAPYIPTEAIGIMPPEARLHDARGALYGGADRLEVPAAGGHLLVETSDLQALQTIEIFACNGLIPQVASSDELDATIVIGTRPALHT